MTAGRVIALAGNPNVGKSTLFNRLTGLHQHTGNWPGKTVENARGRCTFAGQEYLLVDLPGTYSLLAHSAEEETARDFLCFGHPDACIVVCDATCLERSLNLALQVREISPRTIICVNLCDEAAKKGVHIHRQVLENTLGIPVVTVSARDGRGIEKLLETVEKVCTEPEKGPLPLPVPEEARRAVGVIEPVLRQQGASLPQWASLRLLEGDTSLKNTIKEQWKIGGTLLDRTLILAQKELEKSGLTSETLTDRTVASLAKGAEEISRKACKNKGRSRVSQQLDRILTGKWTGIPVMLLLLAGIFWITIAGANIPSQWLWEGFSWLGEAMSAGLIAIGAPPWLEQVLVMGIWRVLSWVVSVMLPPMAVFFPLFTLLEDLGYLPRVAFTLDHCFQKAGACGKQALTMCMGFGCNAVGVTGCRIIDSPRERLVAAITNSFVPCNGRFPPPLKGRFLSHQKGKKKDRYIKYSGP